MDLTGNPILVFPGDAPGDIGWDHPKNGPIGIEKIIWRRSQTSTPADSDAVCLKSNFGAPSERDLFHRIWATGDQEHVLEIGDVGPFNRLHLTNMSSGVIEIWLL